jgi:cysteine desulfurase
MAKSSFNDLSGHFKTSDPAPASRAHSFCSLSPSQDLLPAFGGIKPPEDQIYLDYAAATPVEASVLLETLAWQTNAFANPANRLHRMGEYAEHALMEARIRLGKCLGATPDTQIIFTSSATEANNLALRGLALHPKRKRNRFVYSPTEHSSVIETILALQKMPLSVPIEAIALRVDENGQIDLDHAISIINEDTICVSVMDLNNETGVIQERLSEIIEWSHRHGVLVHCDAVQGFGRAGFRIDTSLANLAVVSSGKIYGPRGAAALCLTPHFNSKDINSETKLPIRLSPQLTGGGQESGWRSSTPNLAAIRGFARAAELLVSNRQGQRDYFEALETVFVTSLKSQIHRNVRVYGTGHKIPGLLMFSIEGVNSMKLIEECQNICVSTGSACRTLQATASHVLLAMGIPLEEALGSMRISMGLPTTRQEVEAAAATIARVSKTL